MKPFQIATRFFTVLALVALAVGCASNGNHLLDRENVAMAAGFKIITPTKPSQRTLLAKLPADKVTTVKCGGKPYYILPDLANDRAFVGGPKQFQSYLQLRQKQKMDSKNAGSPSPYIETVEVNETNWGDGGDWGDWGGWDAVGGPDGLGWPGWY
jgi:hypothetical protein